jgi:subtilisin family serine protease
MNIARVLLVGIICCLLPLGGQAHATPRTADEQILAGNTLLVKFDPGTPPAERTKAAEQIGGVIVDQIEPLNVAVVQIRASSARTSSLASAANTLSQHPHVVYAEQNVRFEVADEHVAADPYKQRTLIPIVAGLPVWTPNDLYYGEQHYAWDQISAPAAWGTTQGNSTTVIAIVDTGIQLNHPDLRAKIVPGADFVGDRETPNPNDGHGHGTHVAGLAAASTNNVFGVAGACPRCKLMPVRVLNDYGMGDLAAVAQGMVYAVDHGAKIINLSLVGSEESATLSDAMDYAWNKGALPVCAAGNRNSNNPAVYPASHPRCFTVGATNSADAKADFSNYGPWVSIAAPGADILSTTCVKGVSEPNTYPVCTSDSTYGYDSGTSMAAPVVAGAAGILAGGGLSNAQLRQRLCATADPVAGTGSYWTCGRLNLFRAVTNR